jgi:hypothetical protein
MLFRNLPDSILNYTIKSFLSPKEIIILKSVSKQTGTINWLKYIQNVNGKVADYTFIIQIKSIDLLNHFLEKPLIYLGIHDSYQELWIQKCIHFEWIEGLVILIEKCRKMGGYEDPKDFILRCILKMGKHKMLKYILDNNLFRIHNIYNWNILKNINGRNYINKELRDLLLIRLKDKLVIQHSYLYNYDLSFRSPYKYINIKKPNYNKTWDVVLRDKDYETARILFDNGVKPPKKVDGKIRDRFLKDPQMKAIVY